MSVRDAGLHYVRIQVTSESFVPGATFLQATASGFTPIIQYTPGDFAVFDLTRSRVR